MARLERVGDLLPEWIRQNADKIFDQGDEAEQGSGSLPEHSASHGDSDQAEAMAA